MALPIFPISPLPGNLDREQFWQVDVNRYDSGARQGRATYLRPLFRYRVSMPVFNEVRQEILSNFVDSVQGPANPFLMKDPYVFRVQSNIAVRSGLTNAATVWLYDTKSFFIRADTLTIGSLFSSLSGYVRLGVEFNYEQDTGLLTVNTKATTDVWGVRSAEYYRKCAFEDQYSDRSRLWNIFGTNLTIWEIV
jgi:hypothetical protein